MKREDYVTERNRIRSNWSKSAIVKAANGEHLTCTSDCGKGCQHNHSVTSKGGLHRTEASKKLEILNQLKKACENGDAQALKNVLRNNAGLDIDALEDEGEMPSPLLNLAAESGFCDFVKVLIDEGKVEVDTLGEFGTTALFDACYFDNRDVAEALLDRGANPDFQDPDGSTPLYAAAFQGNLQCLDLMLSRKVKFFYYRAKDKLTPLHAAVLGGNKECVVKLIEAGHPLDPVDIEMQTPLLAASNGGPCGSNGKKDCLLELLKAGADVRAVDCYGRNAMHLLLLQGIGCPTCTYECAERLLEKQASVLEQDTFGKTAAQHLGEMKPAPKLYALLKRAIKRESLRNKLQRTDEPEVILDAATLEEQERQAERSAMELIQDEEQEKLARESKKEKAKKKKQREKERKERNRDKESSTNPSTRQEEPSNSDSPVESNVIMDQSAHEKSSDKKDESSPEGKHHQPHVKQSKTADKKAKRSTAPIPTVPNGFSDKADVLEKMMNGFGDSSFSNMFQSDGDEEDVDEEIEAFRLKLEQAPRLQERPCPKITLNPEALRSLRSLKQ